MLLVYNNFPGTRTSVGQGIFGVSPLVHGAVAVSLSYMSRRMGNAMFSFLVCALASLPLIR